MHSLSDGYNQNYSSRFDEDESVGNVQFSMSEMCDFDLAQAIRDNQSVDQLQSIHIHLAILQ
jgi:hypothetical protein